METTLQTLEANWAAEPAIRAQYRDQLTRRATAFPNYAALTADMAATGYFPTLSRRDPAQAELGRVLESEQRRVYWVR